MSHSFISNVELGANGSDFKSATNAILLVDGTAPSANADAGQLLLYNDGGDLKIRAQSGEITLGAGGGGAATALATTGADVNVSSAAPPTVGQVLEATSATTATWQTLSTGATDINGLSDGYTAATGNVGLLTTMSITTGDHNIGIGTGALSAVTTGFHNICIGNNAGNTFTQGEDNVIIGRDAGTSMGTSTITKHNVLLGGNVVPASAFVDKNVIIGESACLLATSPLSQAVIIGREACGNATTIGGSSVVIGWRSYYVGSGNFSVSIGHQAGLVNTTGANNVYVGARSGSTVTSGSDNICIGVDSGSTTLTTGSNNILIGNNASVDATAAAGRIAIGQNASATVDNGLFFSTSLASLGASTNFTINTTTGQAGPESSSRRFKYHIEDLLVDSSKIYNLEPKSYHRSEESTGMKEFGYIAEEVIEHIPEVVPLDKEGLPFSMNYRYLPILIIEEMKKLRDQVVSLQAEVQTLRNI